MQLGAKSDKYQKRNDLLCTETIQFTELVQIRI